MEEPNECLVNGSLGKTNNEFGNESNNDSQNNSGIYKTKTGAKVGSNMISKVGSNMIPKVGSNMISKVRSNMISKTRSKMNKIKNHYMKNHYMNNFAFTTTSTIVDPGKLLFRLLWPIKLDNYEYLYKEIFDNQDTLSKIDNALIVRMKNNTILRITKSKSGKKPSKWFKTYARNIFKSHIFIRFRQCITRL